MKKIIIYGNINLNIIDGSAIWLRSLVEMVSELGCFDIHVILKTPVSKDEIKELPRVKWVDPFLDIPGFKAEGTKLTEEEALAAIEIYDKEVCRADIIIIRQVNWLHFACWNGDCLARTYIYNISRLGELVKKFGDVLERCGGLLVQTELMLDYVNQLAPERKFSSYVMSPMIPDDYGAPRKMGGPRLVYSGKFTAGWQVKEMLLAFKDVLKLRSDAEFHVAGDKFDNTVDKNELIRLFRDPSVFWHNRLSRDESMALVRECNIGLGYRVRTHREPMEVSTKLLEYCMSGLPVITNNTEIHRQLFGYDYPFFANSIDEFKSACLLVLKDESLYAEASKRCWRAAQGFGYKSSGSRFLEFFHG